MILYEAGDKVTIDTMSIANPKIVLPAFFVDIGRYDEAVLVNFTRIIRHKTLFCSVGETQDILEKILVIIF